MTMAQPDVTVVIGAYEAMPYLVECLASVEAQIIDPERVEVVAVDDGSTDGTGEYLEEFAGRASLRVTLLPQFGPGYPKDSDRVRRRELEPAELLMDAHRSEGVARHLKVEERLRLRLYLVAEQGIELRTDAVKFTTPKRQAPALLERRGRRVYLVYPHFRDRAAGIPDSVYLASPHEARAFPGYREGGTTTVLRRAARRARRLLAPAEKVTPEAPTATAA
ncbi:hypothetical protein GCM10027073_73760 [Streptomyces chlorus]|uniref:Glycosyltransferase family 2 protein n=1 Tax=Streptomyces chlorus TaxID=887452 RepID=A0ABW1E8T6_9ACTN